MIQARDLTFNIEYGIYIKALEDKLARNIHFGKGNYLDIGAKVYKLSCKYKYYTEADHATFDAHVTTAMLQLTHTFYQSCYHHNPKLRRLSSRTLKNRCSTRDGIKYTVTGTRMSGDVDTSLGNSLINYAILRAMLKKLDIAGDVIVNGDDSIIFTNEPIPIDKAMIALREYNMETVMLPSTRNIHKVEFCRTKLIINNLGIPTMMINPARLFDIFGMTYKTTGDYYEYLRQVAVCNIACNMSNPLRKVWTDIVSCAYGPDALAKITTSISKHTDKKQRMIAMKNLHCSPDSGEFNTTVYAAFGNLDYVKTNKIRIIEKLKRIRGLGRINSEIIKYLPVGKTVDINHMTKRITTY
jgi:hypothetical protein